MYSVIFFILNGKKLRSKSHLKKGLEKQHIQLCVIFVPLFLSVWMLSVMSLNTTLHLFHLLSNHFRPPPGVSVIAPPRLAFLPHQHLPLTSPPHLRLGTISVIRSPLV